MTGWTIVVEATPLDGRPCVARYEGFETEASARAAFEDLRGRNFGFEEPWQVHFGCIQTPEGREIRLISVLDDEVAERWYRLLKRVQISNPDPQRQAQVDNEFRELATMLADLERQGHVSYEGFEREVERVLEAKNA